jgi:hypothetical protein
MTVNGFRQASEVKAWSSVYIYISHTQTYKHTNIYTHTHTPTEALNSVQISNGVLHFMKVNIVAAEYSDGKREGVTTSERYSPVTVYLAQKYAGPTFSARAQKRGDRGGRSGGKLCRNTFCSHDATNIVV